MPDPIRCLMRMEERSVKLFKKLVSLLLSLTLLSGVLLAAEVTVRAQEADPPISSPFTMLTLDGYDPGELVYYYSDDYFRSSGKELDPHLRTMSAVLTFSIRGVSATPEETYGALLREIGFGDIVTYDMDQITTETIGVVLAHKTIDGKDVVAVAIRGDDYGVEMAANFIAGAEGDIEAFASAEALVESRVGDYLEAYGITAAQYWVVGYSRSGAVANLFGRELNRNPGRFCTAADDIFVYTFEAPLSSADDTVYENIHNIIDPRDAVTYVYPAAWSLYSSGVPSVIGSGEETITMYYLDFDSATVISELGEVKVSDFLTGFFAFIAGNVSRAAYAEKLQAPLSQLLEIFIGLSQAQQQVLLAYFEQVGEQMINDPNLFFSLLSPILDPYSRKNIDKVTALVKGYMDQVSEAYGKPVDDESYAAIQAAIRPLVQVMLPLFSKDYTASYQPEDGSEPVSAPLYRFVTFFSNLVTLFKHHMNYNILAELMAEDSYYAKESVRIRGDADGDGHVNILDATRVQRWLAGFKVSSFDKGTADADGSGSVTVLDATAIQRYLASLETYEGIGSRIG